MVTHPASRTVSSPKTDISAGGPVRNSASIPVLDNLGHTFQSSYQAVADTIAPHTYPIIFIFREGTSGMERLLGRSELHLLDFFPTDAKPGQFRITNVTITRTRPDGTKDTTRISGTDVDVEKWLEGAGDMGDVGNADIGEPEPSPAFVGMEQLLGSAKLIIADSSGGKPNSQDSPQVDKWLRGSGDMSDIGRDKRVDGSRPKKAPVPAFTPGIIICIREMTETFASLPLWMRGGYVATADEGMHFSEHGPLPIAISTYKADEGMHFDSGILALGLAGAVGFLAAEYGPAIASGLAALEGTAVALAAIITPTRVWERLTEPVDHSS